MHRLAPALFILPILALQQSAIIPDAPSCTGCRIDFTLEVAFGDDDGPGAFVRRPLSIVRDSKGNYFALGGMNPPQVFDSSGRYLRTIGRMGQGPGEFRSPLRMMMAHGDTLYVFQSGRFSVFSPGGMFIRMVPTGTGYAWVAQLANQHMLVRATISTGAAARNPLHIVDGNGNVIRSFAGHLVGTNLTALASSGDAWVGWFDRYELVRLDTLGREEVRLQRNAQWLPRDQPMFRNDTTTPPRSSVWSVREDRSGLLWVIGQVPGPRWKEGLPVIRADGTIDPYATQFDVLQNSIVEVLDPASRRLVATGRFPGYIVGFIDDNRVLAAIEDSKGIPRAQIWRVALRRQ